MSYIGIAPSTAAFPFDQFSGNGTTTAFTMSYAPAGSTSIIVYIAGVIQNPSTYTVSGLTITFTTAPAAGTNNIGVLFLGIPASGIVNTGSGTVTSVSVISANGLAGTVATATSTPAITLSTSITGVLKGNGTAISAATSGTDYAPATSGTSILYGNGSGGFSNVTVGSGLSFSAGTLSTTGGGGSVTSVTGTSPVVSSGGSTPDISLASGYGDTQNPYASKTANYFLAAPNGSSGAPTFRAIVAADIPTLNQSTTGNADTATSATTATTANSLATGNNYQVNSLGVGTAGSGTTGEIRATNNVTAYYSSDRSLKENIRNIPNALDKVLAIGGKLFDWRDDYIQKRGGEDGYFVRKADFGVIAQDVQPVLPEAVRNRDDGTLAVDYEKLCALAFAAIKELKEEVDVLKGVK
jgi:hypothetical protein